MIKCFAFHKWLLLSVCVMAFVLLLSACEDKTVEPPPPPPPVPNAPRVKRLNPTADTLTVLVGTSVEFFAEVAASELDYKVWRVDGKNVTLNPSTDPNKYKHTFATEGTVKISMFATNKGGSEEAVWTVKVTTPPKTRTQLLTNDKSKKWKYVSIKINNEGTELIKSYEKDNVIEFLKDRKRDSPAEDEYNYIHNVGSNVDIGGGNKEATSKGIWKLSSGDLILGLTPLYDKNLTIRELTETKLVFSIRVTEMSTIYYNLQSVK